MRPQSMLIVRVRLIALLVVLSVATAIGFQSSPINRPWPPGVQTLSDESPVISAADALKTF
jgi:hypothetical protein